MNSSKRLKFRDNGHIATNGRLDDLLADKRPRPQRHPKAKTDGQRAYMEAIEDNDVILASGPSGAGKTHLAVGMAVQALRDGECRRIVAVRPCLGVGRTMGYLPGEIEAKVAPYLRPIMDELHIFMSAEEIRKYRAADIIELGSLEYIRGRNFNDTFVILDEAQNCTEDELKAFLTRLGFGSKFVITGDITRHPETGLYTQCDLGLAPGVVGAFERQCGNLANIEGIVVVEMTRLDIVRHPLVAKMIERGL